MLKQQLAQQEAKTLNLELELPLAAQTEANVLLTRLVDEETCNPLKVWHDLGEPANLTEEQIELLKSAAKPLVATQLIDGSSPKFTIKAGRNAVVYFEAACAPLTSDNSYDYSFYEKM